MKEISPSVLINGETYVPEGWMWVLAFALADIPWAVELVTDPNYNLREKINSYNSRQKLYHLQLEIDHLERQLMEAKQRMEKLQTVNTFQ